MKPKFCVGDQVRCVNKPGWDTERSDGHGYGWREGLVFRVHSITPNGIGSIYWPGQEGDGVHEDSLELVCNNKWSGTDKVKKFVCLALIGMSLCGCGTTEPDYGWTIATNEKIAEAIWHAEGGEKTRYPYGIMGYGQLSKEKAYQICLNTIRNNKERFKNQDKYSDFIEFLGSRYCPPAEHELNVHWVGNVKYFLNKQ
jgi:hypothetical protein